MGCKVFFSPRGKMKPKCKKCGNVLQYRATHHEKKIILFIQCPYIGCANNILLPSDGFDISSKISKYCKPND